MKQLLKVFSNITRVKILACLSREDKNVSDLIENCGLSQSAVSQHLKILKDSGLVECASQGREKLYRVKYKQAGDISRSILKLINKLK
jgi:DNA-binding transcriptional ArsR family regulator